MTAYEFYWRDEIKGFELVGVLPEGRTNPKRISEESIVRLGRKHIGKHTDARRLLFVQVNVNSETGEITKSLIRSYT